MGGGKRKREREGSREGGRKDGFPCLTWGITVLLRLTLKLGLKGSFHFSLPSSRRQVRLVFLQETYCVVFHAPNLLRDRYITITSIEYIILCCLLFRFTNNFNTMVRMRPSSHLHEPYQFKTPLSQVLWLPSGSPCRWHSEWVPRSSSCSSNLQHYANQAGSSNLSHYVFPVLLVQVQLYLSPVLPMSCTSASRSLIMCALCLCN